MRGNLASPGTGMLGVLGVRPIDTSGRTSKIEDGQRTPAWIANTGRGAQMAYLENCPQSPKHCSANLARTDLIVSIGLLFSIVPLFNAFGEKCFRGPLEITETGGFSYG